MDFRRRRNGFTLVELPAVSGVKREAFTLVELLVVIGIIALLIGILIPVANRVRKSSAQVACAAQLRDIGVAYRTYINDNKGRMPRVETTPSAPILLPGTPTIVDLLKPYTGNSTRVFECRQDHITLTPVVNNIDTYYQREGSSYQYNPALNPIAGQTKSWEEMLSEFANRTNSRPQEKVIIFYEYEAFHGKPGTQGAMNYLFADMHVGDYDI